jgi:mannose-6-phosphate isomerase
MQVDHDQRPWGEFRVLEKGHDFQVKRIDVHEGQRFSYQSHRQRSEHWVIVTGRALVTLDGVDRELGPGDTIDIPVGARHRLQNCGQGTMTFIEIQRGPYLGEDDIERYEDDYGRTS